MKLNDHLAIGAIAIIAVTSVINRFEMREIRKIITQHPPSVVTNVLVSMVEVPIDRIVEREKVVTNEVKVPVFVGEYGLPKEITIEASNDGKYRWKTGTYTDFWTYDSAKEAAEAWKSLNEYNLRKASRTWVTK